MLIVFSHSPLVAIGQALLLLLFGALMLLSARRSRPNIQWSPSYQKLLTEAYEELL